MQKAAYSCRMFERSYLRQRRLFPFICYYASREEVVECLQRIADRELACHLYDFGVHFWFDRCRFYQTVSGPPPDVSVSVVIMGLVR